MALIFYQGTSESNGAFLFVAVILGVVALAWSAVRFRRARREHQETRWLEELHPDRPASLAGLEAPLQRSSRSPSGLSRRILRRDPAGQAAPREREAGYRGD